MKLKHVLTLSIATLLTVGCTSKETIVNQPPASPVAQSVPNSTESIEAVKQDAIKSGTFVSGEHPTQGTARIVLKNGKPSLELDQSFKTSDQGPDLVVILHRSGNVLSSTKPPSYPIKQSDYVILAPLKKFSGAQSYSIPNNINLADYKSAVIWCRKFNATFGVAAFKSV
ncbi:MAG TPA: electron transfer protein with DM13 domain protein [Cyanobacteria bacterium UBA8553]|nr:electron transfer protein with DM13 domain protein [Cyanobacteria bacterium UBA8553]HAJ57934.1 electron transfer protein with DM13 domain protein [Cyanobacteria bacterium UBA8543]